MLGLGLGTGLGAGRGEGQGGAPRCLVPPAISGPGRVGALHQAAPGVWQGAAQLALQWLRDGAPIAGATAADYRAAPADDRRRLGLRVTARGAGGSRKELSENEIPISYEPPAAVQSLPDQRFGLHSGEHHLDASSAFTGSALTFGVTGEGVSIDPETGLLTITTDRLFEGVTVTVAAINSGGQATSRFTLTIAADDVAPGLIANPGLVGPARIGETVSLEPGAWGGQPAPELAFQWLIDGVDIPGATGTAYVPVAADDGCGLAARVTATNPAGSAAATTPALPVTQAPPVAGALADVAAALGSGPLVVEAAAGFAGAALVFAVAGAGATVDPLTGRVTIPTDAALEGVPVTVTATNSGGSASLAFRVTVAAAEAPLELALAPANAELVLLPDLDPEQSGLHIGLRITDARHPLHPAQGGTGYLAWTDAEPAGRNPVNQAAKAVPARRFATPGDPQYGVWALSRKTNGGPVAWADRSNQISDAHVLAFNWSASDPATTALAAAVWQGWGPRFPAFTIEVEDGGVTPAPVAPFVLAAPALAGSGVIGAEVGLDPGHWGGEPAPALAVEWLRDGAVIPGATGLAYLPGPEDDRTALAARVTATNAGGSTPAVTAALAIAYAAPQVVGALYDEVFDEGSGPQVVETAAAFAGEALVFAVEGAGATIEPASGRVWIPTEAPVSGAQVTVTAANSGGSVALAFLVTVEAALPLPEAPDLAPANAELVLLPDLDPEQTGLHLGLRVTDAAHPLHPAAGGTGQLAWTDGETAGRDPGTGAAKAVPARRFATPGDPQYGVWALTRRINGGPVAWADRSTQMGESHALAFNWTADDPAIVPAANALWQGWGPRFPAFTLAVPGGDDQPGPRPSAAAQRFPFRTEAEHLAGLEAGYEGGDGGQLMTGKSVCRTQPRFMTWCQDMGGIWLSFDAGRAWWRPAHRGLFCYLLNDVVFDPADPRRIAVLAQESFPATTGEAGLYVSDDMGMSWTKKVPLAQYTRKMRQAGLVWSPVQTGGRTQRVHMMVNDTGASNNEIGAAVRMARSTDGGASFTTHDVGNGGALFGSIWELRAHPTDADVFFAACSNGLFRVVWSGATPAWTNLAGQGGLPAGSYGNIAYLEREGSNTVIVAARGNRAYRTTQGGAAAPAWSEVLSRSFDKLFISPYHPSHWVIIRAPQLEFSTNAGASWTTVSKGAQTPRPGYPQLDFDAGSAHLEPVFTGVPGEIVKNFGEQGWMRSADWGATWRHSTDGFSGCQSEQPQGNGQRFAANNAAVVASGLTDKGGVVSLNGGRWMRRAPSGIGGRLGFSGAGHKTTMRTMAVHPDYGRGTGNDVLLGLMNTWTRGDPCGCLGDVGVEANWYAPQGVATGGSRATFVGFDLSNPQYAYMRRSRSTGHGKQGTWAVMAALPSDFEVMGMTRDAPGLANGQAIFAIETELSQPRVVIRSTDRGASWQTVLDLGAGSDPTRINHIVGPTNGLFLPHPRNHQKLFVAGPSSGSNANSRRTTFRVYDLAEGTPTARPFQVIDCLPANINAQLVQSGRFFVQTMVPDWRSPDTIWYVVNGLPGTGVPLIRTTDGGASWENLAHLVPDVSIASIDVSPHTGDVIIHGPSGGYVIAPPYAQAGSLHAAMAALPGRVLDAVPE